MTTAGVDNYQSLETVSRLEGDYHVKDAGAKIDT